MSVYIDNAFLPFRNMLMCHLIADTQEELLAMVDKIKVQRKWIQYPRQPKREHFDICSSKRVLAIKAGAVSVGWKDLAVAIANRDVDGKLKFPENKFALK